ncbi:hypothetical protein H6P81_002714 [Aristolochia fimbriata]|uniref:Uncharacterized protein n=1 Tax=Aristolochia fimbriata TaxID=158543 RepID=A0AAV7FEE3_ARIFI|nr:hypothetical protein H6P81_002714 [Aristolochia fimbriata]
MRCATYKAVGRDVGGHSVVVEVGGSGLGDDGWSWLVGEGGWVSESITAGGSDGVEVWLDTREVAMLPDHGGQQQPSTVEYATTNDLVLLGVCLFWRIICFNSMKGVICGSTFFQLSSSDDTSIQSSGEFHVYQQVHVCLSDSNQVDPAEPSKRRD